MSGDLRVVIPGCSRPYWIHCVCDDLMNEFTVRLIYVYIYIYIYNHITAYLDTYHTQVRHNTDLLSFNYRTHPIAH